MFPANPRLDSTAIATVRTSDLCRASKISTLVNFGSLSKSKSSQFQRNSVVDFDVGCHNVGGTITLSVKNHRKRSRGFIFKFITIPQISDLTLVYRKCLSISIKVISGVLHSTPQKLTPGQH